jgi:hypothetical protein
MLNSIFQIAFSCSFAFLKLSHSDSQTKSNPFISVASSLAQKNTYTFEQGTSGDISCAFSDEVTLINLKRDKEVLWIKYGDQNPFSTTQNRFQSISSRHGSQYSVEPDLGQKGQFEAMSLGHVISEIIKK